MPVEPVEAYLDRLFALMETLLPLAEQQERREEIRTHLLACMEARRELGLTLEAAVRETLAQFGDPEQLANAWRQETRKMNGKSRKISRRNAIGVTASAVLTGGLIGAAWVRPSGQAALPAEAMTAFNRDLSAQFEAGQSLVRTLLYAASQQQHPGFRQAILAVEQDVEAGYPLSLSMAKHPAFFATAYVQAVRQGEIEGALEKVLARYASI
jgi:hypothetical protein